MRFTLRKFICIVHNIYNWRTKHFKPNNLGFLENCDKNPDSIWFCSNLWFSNYTQILQICFNFVLKCERYQLYNRFENIYCTIDFHFYKYIFIKSYKAYLVFNLYIIVWCINCDQMFSALKYHVSRKNEFPIIYFKRIM